MSRDDRATTIWLAVAWGAVLLAAALLLTACGTAPTIPTEVRVPVPVACVDEKPVPPKRLSNAQLKALDDYRLVLGLMYERAVLDLYVAQLEAALAGCWLPAKGGTSGHRALYNSIQSG